MTSFFLLVSMPTDSPPPRRRIAPEPPRAHRRGPPPTPTLLATLCALCGPASVWAQAGADAPVVAELPTIEVRGQAGAAGADATVLSGPRLQRQLAPSLGATLDGWPGVASAGFGPAVGRPVVRGQDGSRVAILSNGSDSIDASALSPDHAVPIEPLTLERVELLRGPEALRYSSHAVGGVINTVDGRIPRERLDGTTGALDLRAGGADLQRAAAATVEAGSGDWAWHADVFSRDSDDLRTPRHEVRLDGGAAERDRVDNSSSRTQGGAVGGTWFGERGWLGASVDGQQQVYGSVAEEDVRIRMRRNAARLAGEWRLDSALQAVRGELQYTDYRHVEWEAEVPGTTFTHAGGRARLELDHAPLPAWGGLSGTWGLQGGDARFAALGEEAFLPRTRTQSLAAFALERWRTGAVAWSAALRGEHTRVASEGDAADASANRFGPAQERRFDTVSAALGLVADVARGWQVEARLAHTERAPSYDQLYANGVHVATGSVEVGDAGLGVERGAQGDAAVVWQAAGWRARLGGFLSSFDRYISLQRDAALDVVDNGRTLPGYRFRAGPARLWGSEAELSHNWTAAGRKWTAELRADVVRAVDRDSGEPLPRIAPARLAAGLGTDWAGWTWRLDVRHAARQGRVSEDDQPTPGYTVADVSASRTLRWSGVQGRLFIKLENLGDALAYSATALPTVRELTPAAGRALSAGLRLPF